MTKYITVLAFDPGFGRTGWAFLRVELPITKPKIVVINTDEFSISKVAALVKHRDVRTTYGKKMVEIDLLREHLSALIERFEPDYIAHEDAFLQPGRANAFISLSSWILAAKLMCYKHYKMPIYGLAPKYIKKIFTGKGDVKKEGIEAAFKHRKDITFHKDCDTSGMGEHARDACAVGTAFVTGEDQLPKLLKNNT